MRQTRKGTMWQTAMLENPFLKNLTPEQYDLLAGLFVRIELPPRTYVFQQGEPATHMYVLVDGNISIRYKPYDGPRITLTHLHCGDVFGWSSVVGNATYTSDALSTTSGLALRVRGDSLRNLCIQYPGTGTQILEKLALAVAPRWLDSRRQVERILHREMRVESGSPVA